MILRSKARKVPMLLAKDKIVQFASISPPLLPKILQVLDGRRIDTVYPHRSLELFRLTLDAHPSGSLEKLIDLSGSELSKWRGASACLCNTRRETYAIWKDIGLDLNLEDLAMTRSLGEESCARLVTKDMEYHVVIIGVLTVPVLLPVNGAKV